MNLVKKHVLIVDDDQAIRGSLRRVLEGAGYEVLVAANAQEAEAMFEPGQIDLVVLDLNLPFESGWDVFARLTAQHPSVPVIIITGMPGQYQTALAAGVGALIEKPVDALALLKTMEELLAEPEEVRLRRMCGHQDDTRYIRPRNAPTNRKSSDTAIAAGTHGSNAPREE